jgi:DegT/DnrJ/EryC1/StrS aminotransferase family
MDPILELAESYNLIVVEDACQGHGAEYFSQGERTWKRAGSMGRAAAFSLYPGKILEPVEKPARSQLVTNHWLRRSGNYAITDRLRSTIIRWKVIIEGWIRFRPEFWVANFPIFPAGMSGGGWPPSTIENYSVQARRRMWSRCLSGVLGPCRLSSLCRSLRKSRSTEEVSGRCRHRHWRSLSYPIASPGSLSLTWLLER